MVHNFTPNARYLGMLSATANVERKTDFEKGMPCAEAKIDGKWMPDPFHGDQGIAINVKGKGLVVVAGCSHAGIIDTVEHIKNLSGIKQVHFTYFNEVMLQKIILFVSFPHPWEIKHTRRILDRTIHLVANDSAPKPVITGKHS